MNSTRNVAVAAIAILLLASCSSDSGESTTAPGASTSTTAQATTTLPPATTETPRTTSTTSSPTTTSPTATTDAPTETTPSLFEPGTPEFEIDQTIGLIEQQWQECLRTLPNCDQIAASERTTGDERTQIQGDALSWNSNGYETSNFDALDYRVDTVIIDPDGLVATAIGCVTDPVILTESDGTIVDDRFLSSITEWRLLFIDGVWTAESSSTQGEAGVGPEANLCAT
jgi:hypothetical protein